MMSCSDQGKKENGQVIDDVAVNSSLDLRLRDFPQDELQGEGRRVEAPTNQAGLRMHSTLISMHSKHLETHSMPRNCGPSSMAQYGTVLGNPQVQHAGATQQMKMRSRQAYLHCTK